MMNIVLNMFKVNDKNSRVTLQAEKPIFLHIQDAQAKWSCFLCKFTFLSSD